ncbi:MAG: DUF1553 domain-containing protein [Phycisphaera sp.]|nr:DUF1553 domain-containing protein [Phycisphaera sp.]
MRPTLAKLDAYLAGAVEAWASNPVAAVGETPDANKPRADIVYDDFELGSLDESKWSAHGKAFGQGPVAGTLPNQQAVSGFLGKYLINTYVGGDDSTGIATSKPFTIDRRYVRFLIGGGAHKDETCLNLVVGRKVVRTATGKENERLDPQAWDVSDLIGQQAQLQIVDRRKGPWGHINVDHIVFSDTTDAPVQASDLKITKAPDDATVVQVARRRNLDVALLKRWAAYLDDAAEHPEDPLYAFANAALRRGGNVTATVEPLVKKWRDLDAAYARSLEAANASVVVDYGELSADHWLQDGSAYGTRPKRPGDVQIGNDPTRPIERVFDAGMASRHPAWSKLKWAPGTEGEPGRLGFEKYGQMLRTPTYDLRSGRVYYLVRGKGTAFAAVDSHRMVQGPLHGETVAHFDTKGKWQWFSRQLDRYKDHRIHTEFVPDGDEPFEVRKVVVADNNPDVTDDANDVLLGMMTSGAAKSLDALAAGYRDTLLSVAGRFADGRLAGTRDGEDVAALADWLVGHSELFYNTSDAAAQALAGIAKPIVDEHTRVLADLKLASRLAPAMLEGDAEDEYTLIRGNSNTPGPITPRRFLEGISGSNQPIITSGSGRLELVQRMLDENDPYITRVMVNRIWHHLFGRGIVPSVDNFGVLGQAPTHPELLDWLAYTFRHDAQWSVKRMIKMMVMSSTYRQSSKPTNDTATAADPPNDLLHRMRVKRLEGEAIRDSVLAISGRLDSTMYGAPVPVHLTDFMTGRGRPGQNGPLDGAGRRSIYTSVRRNFLSPMMLAFDTPIPFNTIGRRATSNVPAQALILMNDPFVVQQAEVWAKRVLAEGGTAEQRVERMYTQAYARRPSQAELADALGFVDAQAKALNAKPDDPRVWTDLCHVMMNVKEFIFVN